MTTITQTWSVLSAKDIDGGNALINWTFVADAGNGFLDQYNGINQIEQSIQGKTNEQLLELVWADNNEVNKDQIEADMVASVQKQLDTNNPSCPTPAFLK